MQLDDLVNCEKNLSRNNAAISERLIGPLYPLLYNEGICVENASSSRKLEFAAGRAAARAALKKVGCKTPCAIGKSPTGAPIWPYGYRGSISHHGESAFALAYPIKGAQHEIALDVIDFTATSLDFSAAASFFAAAGDIPPDIFDSQECDPMAWVFSAKEAAIKIWGVHSVPSFHDIAIQFSKGGLFTAKHDLADKGARGRAWKLDNKVLAVAWAPFRKGMP